MRVSGVCGRRLTSRIRPELERGRHRACRIELLRPRHDRGTLCVEDLDQPRKIGERPRQPVDLVDDDIVHRAGPDIGEQALQRRPLHIAAREPAIGICPADSAGRADAEPSSGRSTRLRLATLYVLVEWDTHSENVREMAKGKVSHFISSALILRGSYRLVGERTRIVNRMKGTLARLGIRNFKPTLRKAAERLATLHTPEGSALPPNVSAELQRNMARLGVVVSQINEIEGARQKRLEQEPETEPHAMVRHLARVVGIGVETADMLVNEVLSRPMRDRKAVARYAGLTGSPDESGAKRREQGLAKAGNARVRRGMIQLAWRFLRFQQNSALARWYQARTADHRAATRKTMIVALARKLLIALWRFVTTGETLEGVVLRPAG